MRKRKGDWKSKTMFLKNVFCRLLILYLIIYMYPQTTSANGKKKSLISTMRAFLTKLIATRIAFCFFIWLVGWFLNVLVNNWAISQTGPKTEHLTILLAATHETERGDHDFCLSRSHYTDTDPTSKERAATAEIKSETSSPGVARSTD